MNRHEFYRVQSINISLKLIKYLKKMYKEKEEKIMEGSVTNASRHFA